MTPLRPGASLAVLFAALLGLAAPARAETYCIGVSNTSGCAAFPGDAGSAGARLQAAIDAAEDSAGDDTIRLGPGRYDQGGTFAYNPVAPDPLTASLTIQGDAPGLASGVVIADTGTTKDDETVEGQVDTAPLHLRDLTIEGPAQAERSLGLEISAPGSSLDRVSIKAPAGTAKPTALFAAIDVRRNTVTIRNSVIEGFHKAIFTACRFDKGGSALLKYVTIGVTGPITGSGDSDSEAKSVGGVDASCLHEPGRVPETGEPSVTIEDSILAPGVTVREADGGSIVLRRTRWDGAAAQTSGTSITVEGGLLTADPAFAGGTELRLTAGSPMIDQAGGSTAGTDRDGNPRTVGAKPDLGAFEYQGAGGGPTPTPAPGGGTTPTPVPTPAPPAVIRAAPPTPQPGEAGGPAGGGSSGNTVPQAEPVPTLRLLKGTLKLDSRGRVTVRLKCLTSTRCRGKVRVLGAAGKSGKGPILASTQVSIAASKTASVRLTIRAASRPTLRRRGGKLSLAYTPSGAAKATDTLSLKITKA